MVPSFDFDHAIISLQAGVKSIQGASFLISEGVPRTPAIEAKNRCGGEGVGKKERSIYIVFIYIIYVRFLRFSKPILISQCRWKEVEISL